MLRLLHQPYPIHFSRKQSLLIPLLAGLFVALFLNLFQPFGLAHWQVEKKWLLLSGYGFITSLLMLTWELARTYFFQKRSEENWTVSKEIISIFILISSIGLFNFLYSSWLGFSRLSLPDLWEYLQMTFLIGIFPSVLIPLANYLRKLQKHTRQSQSINRQLKPRDKQSPASPALTLVAENEKDTFSCPVTSLCSISAADNYATIVYWDSETQTLKKHLLRSSLSRLEEQLSGTPVWRCHRSHLVNLPLVEQVSGNAQGYRLHLPFQHPPVAVSRSYAPSILTRLREKD